MDMDSSFPQFICTKKRFNFSKNALGSEKVVNPTNIVEKSLVEKLMLENAQLKAQIRKILKIRCAVKLRKRSMKQSHKAQQIKLSY